MQFSYRRRRTYSTPTPDPTETKVELSIEELFFNAEGGLKSVEINSTHNWEIKSNGEWFSISPNKGKAGKHSISINVKSNTEYDDRLGVIAAVIDGNIAQQSLSLMQTGINAIVVSQKVFEIPSLANELNVEIKHSVNFEVIIPNDTTWVTHAETKAMQTSYAKFSIAQNTTSNTRSVQIKIKELGGSIEETVVIQQKGIEQGESIQTLNPILAAMNFIELDSTTRLKLTGLVTPSDFDFIKQKMANLKYLDLGNAELLNDEVPTNAFGTLFGLSQISMLDSITLPNSIKTIRSGAFATTVNGFDYGGINKLPALDMLEKLESIESGAFLTTNYNETNHQQLKLPTSLKSIGSKAFYNRKLKDELLIPNNVKYIGEQAFYYESSYNNLEVQLVLNKNIEYIGYRAFSGNFTINISDITESIIKIACQTGAFAGSNLRGNLIIPSSVKWIENNAFSDCSGLTSLNIPNSITSIGNTAFYQCYGLTGELIIPNSVTSIGAGAFGSCSGLTSLNIPNSITSIGNTAFYQCYGLTGELIIPNSVTTIGNSAFDLCYNLSSIRVSWKNPIAYENGMFPYGKTIYVPNGSIDLYKAAEGWRNHEIIGY